MAGWQTSDCGFQISGSAGPGWIEGSAYAKASANRGEERVKVKG